MPYLNNIRRIVVTGNSPGCGKTYISRIIFQLTNLPLYHLDYIFWKKYWESVTEDEFLRLPFFWVRSMEEIDETFGGAWGMVKGPSVSRWAFCESRDLP